MSEYTKIVEMQARDYLPPKARKQGYPCFIWISPPQHKGFWNNELREQFAKSLEKMGNLHDNVEILQLKKVWDPENSSLFLGREGRFTPEGLRFYWEAVDKAVRYADTIYFKKMFQKKVKSSSGKQVQRSPKQQVASKVVRRFPSDYHRYHWSKEDRDRRQQAHTGHHHSSKR